MRNDLATRHLDEEELVQFLDRELPRRRYAGAREHVRTCWTCHARFAELQSVTAAIVRLEEKLAILDTADDEGVWPDLGPQLREARRELEAVAPRGWAATPFWARLALAGAALATLGLGYTLIGRWSKPSPPAPASSSAPVHREHAAASPSAISPAPRTMPRSSSTIGLELSVIQVLHRLGTDTGEPVQVTATSDGGVRVSGKGLSPENATAIRAALAALPGVAVRFEQPSAQSAATADPQTSLNFTTRRAPFAAVLEAAAGGVSGVETLTNALLDESEEMMARAHALHNLTLRFPAARRSGMNQSELAALAQIEADHTAALSTHFRQIEGLLAPVRRSLGEGDAAPEVNGDGLFDSARRLQRALNAIFGGGDPQRTLPALLAELDAATRQMNRTLETAR